MRSGNVIGELAGRPAAIVSFLDGLSVAKPLPDHCEQVGAALAKMHLLAQDFEISRRNGLTVENWRPLYDSCEVKQTRLSQGFASWWKMKSAFMKHTGPPAFPQGSFTRICSRDNVSF